MEILLTTFIYDTSSSENCSCVFEGDKNEARRFKNAIKRNGGFNIRQTSITKEQFYEDLTDFILS